MRETYQNEQEFMDDLKKANPPKVFYAIKYTSSEAKDVRAGVTVVGARLSASMCFSYIAGCSSPYMEIELASDFIAVDADLKAFQGKSDEMGKAKLKEVEGIVPSAAFRAGEVE